MEKIKPFGNRVLLKRPKEGIRETRGGILLPEDAYYDRGVRCRVIDGGNGCLAGCEGKEVIVSHLVGISIDIDGEKHIIAKEFDVLAIIEEDDENA